MLDFLYLALVAAPLTIAAAALLVMALRSYRGYADARAEGRAADVERAQTHPGGLRKRDDPLAEPASIASLGDVRAIGRSVVASLANDPRPGRDRPSIEELSALVEALAHPPRDAGAAPELEAERPADLAPRRPEPAPVKRVGAGPVATKHCPDCAEEVLAAARVCKHCRYRFDEPEELRRVSV